MSLRLYPPSHTRALALIRPSLLALVVLVSLPRVRADDWPQWRGPQRDGVWRETGIIDRFDKPRLDVVWRAPISSGYTGPTVADGRVYLTDRLTKPKQVERILCFDANTGQQLWSFVYDCPYRNVSYQAGPRASVHIHDGLAYALGTMGHLHCLDAKTGKLVWAKDLNTEYAIRMPIWGIAAAPVIEGDLIIVQIGGEPDACLVAFDKRTGSLRWKALADEASYSAPIVIDQAGRRVLICWTGGRVVGLDPQTGKLYWDYPFPPLRMVIGIATPVVYEDKLLLTSFFDGALLLRLHQDKPGVEKIWHRVGPSEKDTDGIHAIISTPLIQDGYVYGIDSYGELRCLDLANGDRIWEDLTAVPRARWATVHFIQHQENVWMFNEKGELIIARLTPKGFQQLSRAQLIDPTTDQLPKRGGVCWSLPAFANKHIYARNDKELICVNLAAKKP